MDIIKRNFLLTLRSGAFNESVHFFPMSIYKWRRLLEMASRQDVMTLCIHGIRNQQYDAESRLPQKILQIISSPQAEAGDVHLLSADEIGQNHLSGSLRDKIDEIKEEELHSIDTSTETLSMLYIIVGVATIILASDAFIYALVEMGKYLRTKGHLVDFVKLEGWLGELHLDGMANLEAALLMAAFDFSADELPFAKKQVDGAEKIIDQSLESVCSSGEDTWHFKEVGVGVYTGNTTAMRHKLGRSIRYAKYAPITVLRDLGATIVKSLKEIEE